MATTIVTARRTTLQPGREEDYVRIHSTIPDAVATALRSSGVVSWRIWRDGSLLFHTIETTAGYPAMVEAISALGAIDAGWDRLIASLLESGPGSDVILSEVWTMDAAGQYPGQP